MDLPRQRQLFPKDENDREIYISTLHRTFITGNYPYITGISDEGTFSLISEKVMSLQTTSDDIVAFSGPLPSEVYTDPVFFFIYNTNNYYHFLYDTLPYLITYFHLKKDIPNLKVLMKPIRYKFVTEFLELLGITEITYLEEVVYDTVYVSDSYTHGGLSEKPPRREIYDLYTKLASSIPSGYPSPFPRKIYISRRSFLHNDISNMGTNYTTRRKMVNEDELVEKLVSLDYTEVFTECMSTRDKITMFSNATHVVGLIGGGMANLLFSPPNVKSYVIVSPYFLDINHRFIYSMNHTDIIYINDAEVYGKKNGFSLYMRVRTDDGEMGEIENIDEAKVTAKVKLNTDGVGWDLDGSYDVREYLLSHLTKLDEGLNSPFYVNLKGVVFV